MIKCRLIEHPKPGEEKPGDMFYETYVNTGRTALIVILPNGGHFDLNHAAEIGDGEGVWEVTGEPPEITVNPSINSLPCLGLVGWHGWLKDGIFSDA